jgi:hypothetical protein
MLYSQLSKVCFVDAESKIALMFFWQREVLKLLLLAVRLILDLA